MSEQNDYTFRPIGYIETPFGKRGEAPRQPGTNNTEGTGTIRLKKSMNFEQALDDLAGFERIWIIYVFHLNENWKPKVLPPRSDNKKKGVFATRSPYRPNPIGMSVCKLISINGLEIKFENPDMIDGTPVLDIKPYIPYADSYPVSEIGWLRSHESELKEKFAVEISAKAQEQIDFVKGYYGVDIFSKSLDILANDPEPHPYKRIKKHTEFFSISVKTWKLIFRLTESAVVIDRLISGYKIETIRAGISPKEGKYWDLAPHIEFIGKWEGDTPDEILNAF